VELSVGKTLVYPHHGAVTITALTKRTVGGVEKEMMTLNVHTSELTIMLPTDNVELVGVRDVIDSEDVGLLAPSGDAGALAHQVSTLLADPDRARRMGASGRETIVARYNVERLVDDIAALYRELAGPV